MSKNSELVNELKSESSKGIFKNKSYNLTK